MNNMFNQSFNIDGFDIQNNHEPYLIAELSGNHDNDINRAKTLIKAAHQAGFDAVKIQYFTADDMTLNIKNENFIVQSGLWQGQSLYELYQQGSTPREWLPILFNYADELGITLFSSVFSQEGIDTLEAFDCPAYKIASFEAMDLELIKAAAKTHKPIIISTGIINYDGIQEALSTCHQANNKNIGIMHCISNYPAPYESFNIQTISDMQAQLSLPVGLSDHSTDDLCAIAAIAKGACMIEKHITVSQDDGAIDSAFSLPIQQMSAFTKRLKDTYKCIGTIDYSNSSPRKNYRSLYFVEDIAKGQKITNEMLRSIRPGHGLEPKYRDELIGREAAQDISSGTATKWDLIV